MQPSNIKPPYKYPADGLDKHQHLSTSDHEVALTEIEFSIFRIFAAFNRWMDDLAACSTVVTSPIERSRLGLE